MKISRLIKHYDVYNLFSNIFLGTLFLIGGLSLLFNFLINLVQFKGGYQDARNIILNFLFFLLQMVFIIIFLTRKKPSERSKNRRSFIFSVLGTFLPGFFGFRVFKQLYFLDVLVYSGLLVSIVGTVSLGKSLGITVARRNLVTRGLYAYIRHPMYAGYIITNSSLFILSSFDSLRVFLFSLWLFSTFIRIKYEEEFLLKRKDYKKYALKVKYKLIPYFW